MIDKKAAHQHAIPVIENGDALKTDRQVLLTKLKHLLPRVINSDNQLDIKVLQELMGVSSSNHNNQGYELTFAGKSLARHLADIPTDYELGVELEQSKDFETTSNVVICGDNLDVLKILYQNYFGKIKMIYIDPPYNTQNENFVYHDNFKLSQSDLIKQFAMSKEAQNFLQNIYGTRSHSGWLSFMYPRLKLARELLREDGVIFISIDDNEHANLKIMCDEIFGEENFETSMIWRKTGKQTNTKKINRTKCSHEYILCVFKNKSLTKLKKIKLLPQWEKAKSTNRDQDPRGEYITGIMSQTEKKSNVQSKNYYTITTPSGRQVTREFFFPKEEYLRLEKENRLYFSKDGEGSPTIKIFKNEEQFYYFDSIIDRMGTSTSAKEELKFIFGNRDVFDTPKPGKIIKELVRCSTHPDDFILDFFAGSGTTGDAVMQMNVEDGGHRKFILVQWDEKINPQKSKLAHDFCLENRLEPVISSICLERLNRVGQKIISEQTKAGQPLSDIGYKVYRLKEKPTVKQKGEQFWVGDHRSELDTLTNMLVETYKTLDTSIKTIQKKAIYMAGGEVYIIAPVTVASLKKIPDLKSRKINLDGWSNVDLECFLNLREWFKDNLTVVY